MCAYITPEEYFRLEESSDVRHEYHHGEIFAMTGTTEDHILITAAVLCHLGNQLAGKPCRAYPIEFRLKVEEAGLYAYPDIAVVCGPTQLADGRRDTFLNPTLLVEVLSESTEAYDRGKKFELYRTIPTLQEYLLIAQDRPHVERYRRQGHDWILTEFTAWEDPIVLQSIGCTLTMSAIYEQVSFT